MTEILVGVICLMLIFVVGYLCFIAGKEAASEEASYTISSLRCKVRELQTDLDDARERFNKLLRWVNK